MAEPWGVYYDNFEENWPRYNGTALYPVDNKFALAKVMAQRPAITWTNVDHDI